MAGPASDSVLAALKDAERVAKKQKTCAAMTAEALDRVIAEVRTAHARLLAGRGDGAKAAQELNARLQKMDVVAQVSNQTKEVHSAVNKLGKVRGHGHAQRTQSVAGRALSGTELTSCAGAGRRKGLCCGRVRCDAGREARRGDPERGAHRPLPSSALSCFPRCIGCRCSTHSKHSSPMSSS
jgi:hypothetical protein